MTAEEGQQDGLAVSVLVVEDDEALARALGINLRSRGYRVTLARSGRGALAAVADARPEVVLLDLGLPDMDGLEVLAGVRGWNPVPVVVLSARSTSEEKVAALDAGADDYVTKPFDMNELLARLRAAVRRGSTGAPGGESVVETTSFTVDLAARLVHRDGEQVRLTPTQWHLLEMLARHVGRVVTQAELLREVWGPGYEHEAHYLRVHMAQLRRRLEPDPAHPRHLITETGLGYRLEP